MLRLTSHDDLSRLKKTDPAYPLIRDAIQSFSHPEYNPEEEGFVVLIEPDDAHRPFWGDHYLHTIPWEAIQYQDGYFRAVFIPNNEFSLVVLIFCRSRSGRWPKGSQPKQCKGFYEESGPSLYVTV